eukprot:1144217-Pelagomonas_calceolata.AAC.3
MSHCPRALGVSPLKYYKRLLRMQHHNSTSFSSLPIMPRHAALSYVFAKPVDVLMPWLIFPVASWRACHVQGAKFLPRGLWLVPRLPPPGPRQAIPLKHQ